MYTSVGLIVLGFVGLLAGTWGPGVGAGGPIGVAPAVAGLSALVFLFGIILFPGALLKGGIPPPSTLWKTFVGLVLLLAAAGLLAYVIIAF